VELGGAPDSSALLGEDGGGEALYPLEIRAGLGRHVDDGASRTQPRLHLPGAERALHPSTRRRLTRWSSRGRRRSLLILPGIRPPGGIGVMGPAYVGDLAEQLVVER
jgi:hypothetical protein